MGRTKVKVPERFEDGFSVSYEGRELVYYEVNDGQVDLDEKEVGRFLSAVEGSEPVTGTTGDGPTNRKGEH